MAKINRRTLWQSGLGLNAFLASLSASPLYGFLAAPQAQARGRKPIPVIFHTDIGGDVDDTFALLYLLRRPELDLKLVVTEGSNSVYRGRLAAKLLSLGHRDGVTVAIGGEGRDDPAAQSEWIGEFTLKDYSGPLRTDPAQAMVDVIMNSDEPVTIISVGPATTVAAALKLNPAIAHRARFVGMFGSIRTGYAAGTPPEPEYNVKTDPGALRAVLAADWPCSLTPLDTCGFLVLDGALYQRLLSSQDPFARACIANTRTWLPHAPWMPKSFDMNRTSSTLFDIVAVVMAFDESDLAMQMLPVTVLDDGMTVVDPINGKPVRCAIAWKHMDRFKARIVATLTSQGAKPVVSAG